MMELIDTHSHIYDEAFDQDFPDMLARASDAGVVACVMPGIDIFCYDRMIATASAYPDFAYPCIGLHPTSVGESWEEELRFVRSHLGDRKFHAIGEIGLDGHWSREYMSLQIRVLEEQLQLAAEVHLPVIIHLRDATEEFAHVLSDMEGVQIRGTMHAFSGSYETYRELLRKGDFKFGIGGVATYRNAGVASALERMSLDDLVLETDCPWLTPVPHRGGRNEPSYVTYVAEKIAFIKNITMEQVAAATSANARKLFDLPV